MGSSTGIDGGGGQECLVEFQDRHNKGGRLAPTAVRTPLGPSVGRTLLSLPTLRGSHGVEQQAVFLVGEANRQNGWGLTAHLMV